MNKTKIILCDPPYEYLVRPNVQIPLGLLYVAASLETNPNYDVSYVDLGPYTEKNSIENLPEADVYGFTATIMDYHVVERISARLKQRNPKCKIMIGGSVSKLATSKDTVEIDYTSIDAVVAHEGEHIVHTVVEDLMAGKSRGLYTGASIKDIDALPYPARHMVGAERVKNSSVFYGDKNYKGKGGSTNILGSRGCYFNCAFCGSKSIWGQVVKLRNPEAIIEEIQFCKKEYGISQFRFSDDNVTMNKKFITKLCELLVYEDIRWRVSVRTTPSSYEMFKMMYDAGCREVSFGVESFDPNVLKTLNKSATPEQSIKAIKDAHKAGMTVRALFMISTPGENLETVDLNIAAFEEIKGLVQVVPLKTFIPIPGTDIFNYPDRYGIKIIDYSISQLSLLMYGPEGETDIDSAISIDGMTKDEQYDNIRRMRNYLIKADLVNRG